MIYFANLIKAIAWLVDSILFLYMCIVIGSAILSFVNPDPYNPIVRFLRNATEPIFLYIRRYLPFVVIGGLDLSPIVVILAIKFLEFAVVKNLYYFVYTLSQ